MRLTVDIEKRLGAFQLRAAFEAGEETLALLGASGCGKSVTLQCIAGILTPDRGRIELDGRVLFDSRAGIDLPPQQRRVGYLFQQYALFPNMTAEQNIRCGIRGSRRQRAALAAEKIRAFRLEGLEGKYPAQLSGGQQQRVALARILASGPRAILLDEPFSALDQYLKRQLEAELTELLDGFAGPIVWVSHDLGECYRNCRRVCVLEAGRTGDVTTMEDLLRRPATLEAARLTGCRNFFPARRGAGGVEVPDWGLTLPLPVPEGPFSTLAVPAAAIRLEAGGMACTVRRAVRDLGRTDLFLLPDGAPEGAPLLCAETDRAAAPGQRVEVVLEPERLLLL